MQRIKSISRVLQEQPSLLEVTEESLNNYNPDSHPCQRCGKNIWCSRTSGSYSRYMTYIIFSSYSMSLKSTPSVPAQFWNSALSGLSLFPRFIAGKNVIKNNTMPGQTLWNVSTPSKTTLLWKNRRKVLWEFHAADSCVIL